MAKRSMASAGLTMALSGLMAGCSGWGLSSKQKAVPLEASSFYAEGATTQESASGKTAAAANAPAPAQDNRVEVVAGDPPVPTLSGAGGAATQGASALAPQTQAAGTQASAQVGPSTGKFLIYGAVLATVYDRPIYADKVVRDLERPLSDVAKQLGPDDFAQYVRLMLKKQRDDLIRNEVIYTTCDRELSDDDKHLANMLTMKWRMEQIQACGGSVELAKQRASADLQEFEDLVQQQYRHNLFQIYLERRILPRIQVTANDRREFYARNIRQFTKSDQASFRLIKIVIPSGDIDGADAKRRAYEIRARALGGDFAQLAGSSVNDDPELRKSGGLVLGGSVDRGAFIHKEVEKAVWLTGEGFVTDVIREGDAFYIAKVVELHRGQVEAFESEDVQERIYKYLHDQQVKAEQDTLMTKADRDHMVDAPEEALQTTVDMAMQRYPIWRGLGSDKVTR